MEKRNAEVELAKLIPEHENLIKKYDEAVGSVTLVFVLGFSLGSLLTFAAYNLF